MANGKCDIHGDKTVDFTGNSSSIKRLIFHKVPFIFCIKILFLLWSVLSLFFDTVGVYLRNFERFYFLQASAEGTIFCLIFFY